MANLFRLTGDPKYENAAEGISQKVHSLLLEDSATNGLVPIFINANSGKFRSSATITLGARGDSYYEYLLKQWIQTGKTQNYLRDDFLKAAADVSSKSSLLLKMFQMENLALTCKLYVLERLPS